jgi:hypothetical protein
MHVLIGLSTSAVVMSTLVEAVERDYRVIVPSDTVTDHRADVHDIMSDPLVDLGGDSERSSDRNERGPDQRAVGSG